jgi:uncharacterized protein (DUF983 family)
MKRKTLIDCPACGKSLSKSAGTCTQCGHPVHPSAKPWNHPLVLIIVAALFIWFCVSRNTKVTQEQNQLEHRMGGGN